MASCYKCSKPVTGLDGNTKIEIESVCQSCGSWAHCCANCTFYDEYAKQPCRKKEAEYISDRLGRNKCPHFQVKLTVVEEQKRTEKKMSPRSMQKMKSDKAKQNLDKLFGG